MELRSELVQRAAMDAFSDGGTADEAAASASGWRPRSRRTGPSSWWPSSRSSASAPATSGTAWAAPSGAWRSRPTPAPGARPSASSRRCRRSTPSRTGKRTRLWTAGGGDLGPQLRAVAPLPRARRPGPAHPPRGRAALQGGRGAPPAGPPAQGRGRGGRPRGGRGRPAGGPAPGAGRAGVRLPARRALPLLAPPRRPAARLRGAAPGRRRRGGARGGAGRRGEGAHPLSWSARSAAWPGWSLPFRARRLVPKRRTDASRSTSSAHARASRATREGPARATITRPHETGPSTHRSTTGAASRPAPAGRAPLGTPTMQELLLALALGAGALSNFPRESGGRITAAAAGVDPGRRRRRCWWPPATS